MSHSPHGDLIKGELNRALDELRSLIDELETVLDREEVPFVGRRVLEGLQGQIQFLQVALNRPSAGVQDADT